MSDMTWAERLTAGDGGDTSARPPTQVVRARVSTGVRAWSNPANATRDRRDLDKPAVKTRSPHELLSDSCLDLDAAASESPAQPQPADVHPPHPPPPLPDLEAEPATSSPSPSDDQGLISPTRQRAPMRYTASPPDTATPPPPPPHPATDDAAPPTPPAADSASAADAAGGDAVGIPTEDAGAAAPAAKHPNVKPRKKKKRKGPKEAPAAAAATPAPASPPASPVISATGSMKKSPSVVSGGSFTDVGGILKADEVSPEGGVLPTCLTRDSLRDDDELVEASGSPDRPPVDDFSLSLDQSLLPVVLAGTEEKVKFEVPTARRVMGEAGALSHWAYHTVLTSSMDLYTGQPHFECQHSESWFEVDGVVVVQSEKRYSDFEWFHSLLVRMYPSLPVPPVPAKSASGTVDKVMEYFAPEGGSQASLLDDPNRVPLIQDRIHGISMFLSYLGSSPLFANSELLHHFMLKTGQELADYKVEVDDKLAHGLLYGEISQAPGAGDGWVNSFFCNLKGIGDAIVRGPRDVTNRIPSHIRQKQHKVKVIHAELQAMAKSWDSFIRAEEAHCAAATATLAGASFLSAPLGALAGPGGVGGGGSGASPATSSPATAALHNMLSGIGLPASLFAGAGGAEQPPGSSQEGEGGGGGGGGVGKAGGGAAAAKGKLSLQMGRRVVDSAGNRGTVRWAGQLSKAPRQDMTYVGVEWDEALHGTSNGIIFGEKKFDCEPGHGSFTPKEVLYLEPSKEEDPLAEALGRTLMQSEIELSQGDPERVANMRRMKNLLGFWCGLLQSFVDAMERLVGVYSTAALYESQGAADGRSPELARITTIIGDTERLICGEWDHFQAEWDSSARSILVTYTDVIEPQPHDYHAGLARWVKSIPDVTPDPDHYIPPLM